MSKQLIHLHAHKKKVIQPLLNWEQDLKMIFEFFKKIEKSQMISIYQQMEVDHHNNISGDVGEWLIRQLTDAKLTLYQ